MNKIPFTLPLLLIVPSFANAGDYFYISEGGRDLGHIELDLTDDGYPCFDRQRLLEWKIISQENMDEVKETGCVRSKDLYPLNIVVTLIDKVNILTFTFMQSTEIKADPRLSIENRDSGIPAILMNYDVNYKKYEGSRYKRRKRKDNLVVELESGVNYQHWRLRSKQYHDNEDMQPQRLKFSDLHVERDLSSINSRIRIGEGYNNTFYLDSFPYRGVKLASYDNMFPSSQGAVLPWVYGVAGSDAEVEVTQNGKPVHRTMVPPGDFVLRNIKLFDKSGYISMTVTESDGSVNYYDVPWNQLDNIFDKNMWRYDISFGKFMSKERMEESNPFFFQAGAGYGLSAKSSLFGGALISPGYYSFSSGVGQRLNQYGDITLNHQFSSITSANQRRVDGEKLRLQYVANFSKANTSVRLNSDYYLKPNFNDFNSYSRNAKTQYFCCNYYKKEYGVDFAINSSISVSQSLSLSINQTKYQEEPGKQTSYAFKFMQSTARLSFDFDLSYHQYQSRESEMHFGLTFRIPLKHMGIDNTSLNLGYSYNPYDFYQTEFGISGRRLNNNLNYRLITRNGKESKASYQANANYRYAAGESSVRYMSGANYAHYSARSSGSLVAHKAGVTLGSTLGETNALVYAKKHPNTAVPGHIDVVTDDRGYAIISNLIPYQVNAVNDKIGKVREAGEPKNEVVKVPTLGALSYYELLD